MTQSRTSQIDTPEVRLSSEDIFASLHRRGQLLPLFRGVAMEAIIKHAARNAGLTVSDQELQKASERLRRQLGLQSAEKTRDWLHEERLSVEQFELRVEQDLLVEKLKDHLLARFGEQHFQANAEAFSPVKLRRITVSSLNEARELFLQIQEEGGDFAELAGKFSLDSHARQTRGDLGILLKHNLRKEIRGVIFSTKQGSVTSPAHGPDGYEIYLVEEFPMPALDAMTQSAIREELFRNFISLKLRDVKITSPHFPPSVPKPATANAESGLSVSTSSL